MRIVCLSDTHSLHARVRVPEGDLLLHAGDLTGHTDWPALEEVGDWLRSLPHRHKVVIAGNHDFCCQVSPQRTRQVLAGCHYLQDESLELEGLKFYGSPWQPWFFDWAFNLPRGEPLRRVWEQIPQDVDVLLTHGPPHQVLDFTTRGVHAGCEELRLRLQQVRPLLHVFGHIHEGYGTVQEQGTLYVNASICDVQMRPLNRPLVFDWDGGELTPVAT